ncbi:ATP-binding protein [Desulfonatronum thioautotrophicum]|uniref:ATP-binding protein n=1 Tax=Desulfonatronum thioautotrophicum TaxID=617001 RepID=UPI0005EBF229|nr:ATP-binding protein [Desulfonatronum thioautotrophicum]
MQKKEILKQILRTFHIQPRFDVKSRDLELPLDTGKIITVMGVRRCGKTSILLDAVNRLAEQKDKTPILYLSFEDERLDLAVDELDLIIQAYQELYPHQPLADCHFFFDEIQNVDGWERFVRRIYDTITRNIILTGSNSRLLGSEIATGLRGRTLGMEVFPLSFAEYLRFQDITVDLYSTSHVAAVRNAQDVYLKQGGFPELLFLDHGYHTQILQEYFNVLLYRDIVERYKVQNVTALKYFLKRLLSSTTKQLSIHKIFNELKSANIKIGKNTLYDFLEHAESTYLAQTLYRYDRSLVARELGEKKVYAIDTGLCNAVEYKFSEDRGKALENAVFLELKRSGRELFYFRDQANECNFLCTDRGHVVEAVQVCHDVSGQDTRRREVKGLAAACRQFSLEKGTIVVSDGPDTWEVNGLRIDIVPFYRFALSDN